jgi:hypothetical protein
MLLGGAHPFYRRILGAAHEHYLRVEVWSGDLSVQLESDLTIIDGDVSASLGSQVTRQLSMSVAEGLYPVEVDDLMAPYGNRLRVFRGVAFNNEPSPYVWEIFHGRIQEAQLQGDGSVQIQASDRAQDVLDFGFESPERSNIGALVDTEVIRLISDALPDAPFGIFDVPTYPVPAETWEQDRGGALDELAAAVGGYWWALGDGTFVLRRIPWTAPGAPAITLTDAPGGTILEALPGRSRSTVYNSQTATGERADGGTPVWSTRRNLNPASPTYSAGPFGLRTNHVYLQTPGTFGAVDYVARTRLQSSVALSENWRYSCVPDASVELGDVQRLLVRDPQRDVVQVVSGFRIPLGLGEMTVQTRSQVITQMEG